MTYECLLTMLLVTLPLCCDSYDFVLEKKGVVKRDVIKGSAKSDRKGQRKGGGKIPRILSYVICERSLYKIIKYFTDQA